MADDLAPSPPEPRLRGNSAAYLRSRLERDGYTLLLAAIDRGDLSIYGAACEVGYTKRPEPLGSGSPNARKRREWALAKIARQTRLETPLPQSGQSPLAAGATSDVPAPAGNGRPASSTAINLAAAIAEWEEAQRPAPPISPKFGRNTRRNDLRKQDEEILRERKPAPAVLPTPEELAPFATHPALPCTNCREPQATAALREVIDVYVAACRGEPHRTGSVLPRACCQWLRRPDIRALIA